MTFFGLPDHDGVSARVASFLLTEFIIIYSRFASLFAGQAFKNDLYGLMRRVAMIEYKLILLQKQCIVVLVMVFEHVEEARQDDAL